MSERILAETRRRESERQKRAYEEYADQRDSLMIMKQLQTLIYSMKLNGFRSKKVRLLYCGAILELNIKVETQYGGDWS
jgi:hypothetical protein